MKNSIFKKICAVSLSALMFVGTGAAEAGSFIGASLPVYAAGVTPASDFEYVTNDTGTITITGFKGTQTDVVIPKTIAGKAVTEIDGFAFSDCTGLTSIKIPDSVTEIGYYAFSYCTGLTSITIPDSVTEIGEHAFSGCTGLTSITIPKSVTKIDGAAFYGCTGLTSITIPDSVTEIGGYTFEDCTGLTSIKIPDSVTKIGYDAFKDTAWYNSKPDGDVYAGKVYYKYKGTMPPKTSVIIKNGTKGIAEAAFRDCTGLTSITIPDSVTEIGEHAFSGCTGLTSITIPKSVTKIDAVAFEGCTGLTSIKIPDSVTEISGYAFYGCTGLTSIKIPDSVTEIGHYAFENTAWYNSKPDGDVYAGKVYYKYKGTMPPKTSVIIKKGTKGIAEAAFRGCTGLTSIKIPDSVTEIGESAFYGCTGLTSIKIPDSVTEIGESAFYGCTGLTSIKIPDSVTEICWGAFLDCDKLKIVCIKGSYAEQYAIENNIPYKSITAPLKNTSTLSAKKVALGGKIKINLSAAGGIAPYKYSVLYKKSTGTKWATLAANTTKTSVSFTPKAAVTYDLKITAKDSAGKTSSKTVTVTVTKHLTNISKLGAETAKVGEKVKVRCYAQGGTGGYTYAVYYKKSAGAKWSKLRGYKSANIVLLTPKAATSYDVRVLAKDSSGKVVEKILKLTATK